MEKLEDSVQQKVYIPYFKEIFKDLVNRSDDKLKGINKISFLDYCQLPGILGDRLFRLFDQNKDSYLSQREFLYGMLNFYCSDLDKKVHTIFKFYDFDGDMLVTKADITTLI
jgi:Ca2+-binding EF-hand superfamily protein